MRVCVIIYLFFIISNSFGSIQSVSSGNWNNTNTWENGIIPGQYDTAIIQSGHSITLSSDMSITDIIIENGSLNLGPHSLTLYGNITGTDRNNVFSNPSTYIQISEHSSQSDIFTFPDNIQKLKKLTLNRKAGAESYHDIDLDDAVPSDGKVLVLTDGVLYMKNNSILFLNSKNIEIDIAYSDSSHVDGYVQRNIEKNSGIYVFPVGNKGIARPFGVGVQNGNNNNISQVRFIYDIPINSNNVDYSKLPGGIIQYFYWEHTVITGANPQRRLYYEEEDFPGINASQRLSSMTIANTDGSKKWDKATTGWSVNDSYKWIEFDNANASNSTYWTLGSILGNVSYENIDLPITLLSFTATKNESEIYIAWETKEEVNNHKFHLERSYDGIHFVSINSQNSNGTSFEINSYTFYDHTFSQNNIYYRLKQVDFDGAFSYSQVIAISLDTFENIKKSVTIKPLKNEIMCSFNYYDTPTTTIRVYNNHGNCLSQTKIKPQFNTDYSIHVKEKGLLFITIQTDNEIIHKKILML
ncbi:MAG: T9SS type A sorting domain-containing protein [Bacteroidales bacterium]|jgi:hypothetical protein|nr:T9SS type A sorting domain-containing protein [Bacteroidales bacterium]